MFFVWKIGLRPDMGNGFLPVNMWNGKLPPTPTPVPTAEPDRGLDFFRLLEELEVLPGTGISTP